MRERATVESRRALDSNEGGYRTAEKAFVFVLFEVANDRWPVRQSGVRIAGVQEDGMRGRVRRAVIVFRRSESRERRNEYVRKGARESEK